MSTKIHYSDELPGRQKVVFNQAKAYFARNGVIPKLRDLALLIEEDASPLAQKRIASVVAVLKRKDLWNFLVTTKAPELPSYTDNDEAEFKLPDDSYSERFKAYNQERNVVTGITSLLKTLDGRARHRIMNYLNDLIKQLDEPIILD